jgi:hypothetical protein
MGSGVKEGYITLLILVICCTVNPLVGACLCFCRPDPLRDRAYMDVEAQKAVTQSETGHSHEPN